MLCSMESRPTIRRLPPHLRPSRLSPEFGSPSPVSEERKPGMAWWRPLTTRWGVLGIICFIGLAKSGISALLSWIGR
jgi:hypothetical protein